MTIETIKITKQICRCKINKERSESFQREIKSIGAIFNAMTRDGDYITYDIAVIKKDDRTWRETWDDIHRLMLSHYIEEFRILILPMCDAEDFLQTHEQLVRDSIKVGKKLSDALHRLAKTQAETFSKDEIAQVIDRALGHARSCGGEEVFMASGDKYNHSPKALALLFLRDIEIAFGKCSIHISTETSSISIKGRTTVMVYEVEYHSGITNFIKMFNMQGIISVEMTPCGNESNRFLKFTWTS